MALAETAQLAVRIDLEGNALSGIGKLQGKVNGLGRDLGRVGKGVGQVGAGVARAGVIIGTAVVGGLAAAAKAGGDFEAQLRTINTIAQESDAGLQLIGDGIRKLARDGRGDLEDLSTAYYDLLSAGIQAADAQGVLESATTLAIGGLSTNAEAVDLLTTAINAYGQSASEAGRDADLFAKAIEIGKVTADEIAGSFASIAPVAAQTGINIEEVAAAYGALTAQGVPAAEVATQMQRAIVELLNPSADLVALQDKLGVSFLKIAQSDGLVVALQQMRDAVGGDEIAFKNLFGRIEGYKFALQTTGPQQAKYNAALEAMGMSAGTAAAQMGERQQGLNYQLSRLKANLVDAALELSSGFLPSLTRSLTKLSGALSDPSNRANLKSIGEDIGRAIDSIDWDAVVRGARDFATVLKGTLDVTLQILKALNTLPTEIKAAALGFLTLNKLSGGLIGQGIGNIAGGIGSVIARSLGSKLPGVGKLFAQPVFVTNWPLGGVGGGIGGVGKGGLGAALGGGAALGVAATAASAAIVVGGLVATQKLLVEPQLQSQAGKNIAGTQSLIDSGNYAALKQSIDGLKEMPSKLSPLQKALYDLNANGVKTHTEGLIAAQEKALDALRNKSGSPDDRQARNDYKKLHASTERIGDQTVESRDILAARLKENRATDARGARENVSAVRVGASQTVAAINRIPAPIVNVSVTGNSVAKVITHNGRNGPAGGSRDFDNIGNGIPAGAR